MILYIYQGKPKQKNKFDEAIKEYATFYFETYIRTNIEKLLKSKIYSRIIRQIGYIILYEALFCIVKSKTFLTCSFKCLNINICGIYQFKSKYINILI